MEAILIGALLLLALILYVYAVVNIHRYRFPNRSEKALWVNIVYFAPIAGPLLYMMWYRSRQRTQQKSMINR